MGESTSGARGPYAKGVARRVAILDAVIELLASENAARPTLRAIADKVGIAESAILRYFGTMDDLFVAVLERRDEKAVERFDLNTPQGMWAYLEATTTERGLTELFIELSLAARNPGHPAAVFMRRHHERFDSLAATVLGITDPEDARLLRAVAEGLQIQWLHNRSIDVAGGVRKVAALMRPVAPEHDF